MNNRDTRKMEGENKVIYRRMVARASKELMYEKAIRDHMKNCHP